MKDGQIEEKKGSTSLLWTLFAPVSDITDSNAQNVIDWLQDRSTVLVWFTSLVTGSLVLFTLFGRKPGVETASGYVLALSLAFMFFSVLFNLICVWQIPKWKLAIRMGLVPNGQPMTLDLEITSWLSLISFLIALVLAAGGSIIF